MNSHSFMLAERLIPATYLQQAVAAKKSRENLIRQLIEQDYCETIQLFGLVSGRNAKVQFFVRASNITFKLERIPKIGEASKWSVIYISKRKWPEEGWEDTTIELFLADLAQMDSNNFPGNCGVGEREARFACSLVAKRHYRLGHGIGRSGDLGEVQPKAAGSSLLNKLTNSLVLDVIRFMGVKTSAGCFVVPLATGMSLVLCMLTVKQERPDAKFVLWSRIDQKSSFKSIITAGLKPIIIETTPSGDELRTDLVTMEQQMAALGAEHIACVVTTTSCFAPRASDSVDQVAVLCSRYNIPHIINNAYGLQSTRCMHLIQEAARKGRVDAFVQSTDKNFLVPVGGAIIAGFDKTFIEKISKMYPGRASSSPAMDVFITLLSLGVNGYKNLISQRKEMYSYLKEELGKVASKHGEKILETKNNPISIAMTLNSMVGNDTKTITMLGSMLFLRSVSGTRVITGNDIKDVAGCKFEGWGAHISNYPTPYLTAAAALGMKKADVDLFVHRLDKVLSKLKGRSAPPTPTSVEEISVVRRVMRGAGSSTLNGDGGSNSGSGGEQQSQSSAKSSAKSSASTSLASSKDSLRK